MLEAEELRDSARELSFDRREHAVGVDDAPDRFNQPEPLLARETFRHELRELIEVDAVSPGLLRETQNFPDLVRWNPEVLSRVPRDSVALFRAERRVRERDLEQERASGDRDRIDRG